MKVRAIEAGFYDGCLRRVGSVFDYPDGKKLGRWMKPESESIIEKTGAKEPVTLSEIAKADEALVVKKGNK